MFLEGVSYISSAVKKIGQLVCQLICTSCGVPLLVVYVLLCFQGVDVFEYSLSVHNCICDACVADPYKPIPLKRKIGPDSKQNVRSSICQESAGSFS